MADGTTQAVRVEVERAETGERRWGWVLKDGAGQVLVGSGPIFASGDEAVAAGRLALLARDAERQK
jgi:hypothetical protein